METQTQPPELQQPPSRLPIVQLVAWFALGSALGAVGYFAGRWLIEHAAPCEDCQETPREPPPTLQAFRATEAAQGDTAPPDEPDAGRLVDLSVPPAGDGPAGAAVAIPAGVNFADVVPGVAEQATAPGSVIAERAPELRP